MAAIRGAYVVAVKINSLYTMLLVLLAFEVYAKVLLQELMQACLITGTRSNTININM
jgi:hypothetical protein